MSETNHSNHRSGSTRRPAKRPVRKPDGQRPHFESDPEVSRKIREIEDSGEPLSLAEQISREEIKPVAGDDRQRVRDEDIINVTELQRMKINTLREHAVRDGVRNAETLGRRELILEVLKRRVKSQGLMHGEGTLQILPDGFGFLRSPEYHYVSCPDDIYVSPSQIRKFNLRNGALVVGQIRPPKENERYFALLRVEQVNGRDPNEIATSVHFDDLTPLHPDTRVTMEYLPTELSTRVVDMIAPIGFGQRGLIVSPPRAGKTMLMQNMARAVLNNLSLIHI